MNNQLRTQSVLALVALLLVAGCSRESNQNQSVTTTTNSGTSSAPPATEVKQRGNALVRVIHAVPGGAALDFFADDKKLFTGIGYKSTSPYEEVSGERHSFRIRPTGQDTAQPLAENSEGLSDGRHYTVIAMADANGKSAISIYDDDLVPPSAGKAKVRVIHASADAGEVDVYAKQGNKKLFGGVNALSQASYTEVDPMTATLEVRPEGQNNAVLTIPNAKFNAGDTYTIVLTGKAKGAPKLEAMVIQDKLVGGTTMAGITREEYEKNKDRYAEEAKRLGRKIGAGANDGWLWTKTRAALANENDLRDSTINVDVENEVVTLSGSVSNDGQRTKAEKVARGVEGVKNVKNQLTITVMSPPIK
ncbi:MAG TPA: DUF4397 domain-containing protein [Pyrinomonadaceae bacterium]|jgi:hypothetical protein